MGMACFTLLISTCTKDDKNAISTFTSHVDLTGSTLAAHQAATVLRFSTNNGVTYDASAVLKVGEKYKVKVFDRTMDDYITSEYYSFDWSGSNPKPADATSEAPEFTLGADNKLSGVVIDKHCAFDPSSWTGAWGGDEVGACCAGTDPNTITQDTSNPNKFIMNNFWGDHVNAYIIFSPSTTAFDQVVTLPEQTTSEAGVASGSGTYDQCRGTFTIATTYKIGGSTYSWQYNFHR